MFTVQELCDLMIDNDLKNIIKRKDLRLKETDTEQVAEIRTAVRDMTTVLVLAIDMSRERASFSGRMDEKDALEDIIYEAARLLRNICVLGQTVQAWIIDTKTNIDNKLSPMRFVSLILNGTMNVEPKTRKTMWQMVGNLSTNNPTRHQKIWTDCISRVVGAIQCPCKSINYDECLMLLYNLYLGEKLEKENTLQIIKFVLNCYLTSEEKDKSHPAEQSEFQFVFLEHIITKNTDFATIYKNLIKADHRIALIEFANAYLRAPNMKPLSSACFETFKFHMSTKAQNILKPGVSEDSINPKECFALLDLFGYLSSESHYRAILAEDCDMFITFGFNLQTMNDLHKQAMENGTTSVFSPELRPERFAPDAKEQNEDEPFFDFKTRVVRILANMTYKRKGLQDLANKMGFLEAVLNSTQRDTRNPMLQEWCVVCLRNLLEDNPENQRKIAELKKIEQQKMDGTAMPSQAPLATIEENADDNRMDVDNVEVIDFRGGMNLPQPDLPVAAPVGLPVGYTIEPVGRRRSRRNTRK